MSFTSTFPITSRERFLVSRAVSPPELAAERAGTSRLLVPSARSLAVIVSHSKSACLPMLYRQSHEVRLVRFAPSGFAKRPQLARLLASSQSLAEHWCNRPFQTQIKL